MPRSRSNGVIPEPVSLLLVALAVAAVVYLLLRHAREPVGLLAAVALPYPFVYAVSPYTWYVREPRYLFVLAPVIAMLVVVPLRSPPVAAGALLVLVALSVAGMRAISDGLGQTTRFPTPHRAARD